MSILRSKYIRKTAQAAVFLAALLMTTTGLYAAQQGQTPQPRFDKIGWDDEVYSAKFKLRYDDQIDLPGKVQSEDPTVRAQFFEGAQAIFDLDRPGGKDSLTQVPSKELCEARLEDFAEEWSEKEPKAVKALQDNLDRLYDYLFMEFRVRPWWYNPQPLNDLQQAENLPYINYINSHPNVSVESFSHLSIPGADYQAPLLMSIAARNSPEMIGLFIHMVRKYADQKLISPLNEYIGYDEDGNGLVDNDEAVWEPWKSIPDRIKLTCMQDGKIWAIPNGIVNAPIVIIYRRDLFSEAGLDPNEPPRTWDEFLDYSRRLTRPQMQIQGAKFQMGRRGFYLFAESWMWYPWFWAAGGDLVMQHRTCPYCGTENEWAKEEVDFTCKNCGQPVTVDQEGNRIKSDWEATFASDAGVSSLELYKTLTWQLWVRCPDCEEPIVFENQDELRERLDKLEARDFVPDPENPDAHDVVKCPECGERFEYRRDAVIEGMSRISNPTENVSRVEAFENGEVVMMVWYLIPQELGAMSLRPDQIGVAPIPVRTPEDKPYAVSQPTYSAMAAEFDTQAKKDATWDMMSAKFKYSDELIRAQARAGYYRFMPPAQLEQAGLNDFLAELPDYWKENLEIAHTYTRTEPFQKNASYIQDQVFSEYVFRDLLHEPDYDPKAALEKAQQVANNKFLSGDKDKKLERNRPYGYAAVIGGGLIFIGLLFTYIRVASKHYKVGSSGQSEKQRLIAPILLLAPAVLSIALWSYYPLIRGSVMAFQDYRILGDTQWVGIDNFLKAITDDSFYKVMWNTFRYVLYSLSMGFIAPILLAILLTEVPLGKYLFRTIFYLPAVMSPLVVMFLWKLMYNETEYGFLNKLLMDDSVAMTIQLLFAGLALVLLVFAFSNIIRAFVRKPVHSGVGGIITTDAEAIAARKAVSTSRNALKGSIQLIIGFIILLPVLGSIFPRSYFGNFWTLPISDPIRWLTDRSYAMPAVILPFVWAGAGPGCLIYLAALKSVPEDLYEAADVDGAGMWSKLWRITIPTLKPLIVINFVGATIGSFQSMQNILVMTGGQADTNVIGLKIWKEAYIYLNFGFATALAWILGAMLIGFTVMQLNILRKVEFRRAAEN